MEFGSKKIRLGCCGSKVGSASDRPGNIQGNGEDDGLIVNNHNMDAKDDDNFGDYVLAVDDLNLSIQNGEIFALLGHNGAGKCALPYLSEFLLRYFSQNLPTPFLDSDDN